MTGAAAEAVTRDRDGDGVGDGVRVGVGVGVEAMSSTATSTASGTTRPGTHQATSAITAPWSPIVPIHADRLTPPIVPPTPARRHSTPLSGGQWW